MNIGVIVEVVIGIMFVWIFLALITSQVSEWASSLFKWRANMLRDTIGNMLGCASLCEDFYTHPLIKGLHSKRGDREPSYIPNNQFALVVLDVFVRAGTDESAAKKVKEQTEPIFLKLKDAIRKVGENKKDDKQQLARALDTLLIDVTKAGETVEDADKALANARKRMESWFDDAMERLSGAYKRRVQLATLVAGMTVAIMLNADSLAIANALWTQPLVREAVVAQAEQLQLPEDQNESNSQEQTLQYVGELQGLSLPLGWGTENIPTDFNGWFLKVGGITLSGAAAAQGAPFWFEIFRKLLNFRSGSSSKKEEI